MDRDEMISLIDYMRGAYPRFNVDPEKASIPWLAEIGEYSKREVWEVLQCRRGDGGPTPSEIAGLCRRVRAENKRKETWDQQRAAQENTERLFESVPGDSRYLKVMYIQSLVAAEHWISGDRTEYWTDLLAKGAALDIVHDGVDYHLITENGSADALAQMPRQHTNNQRRQK